MTLSLDTAYRSFGGEVEASSTPTICRLPDSRRHQLSAIAPCIKLGGYLRADTNVGAGDYSFMQSAATGNQGSNNRLTNYWFGRARMDLTVDTRTATEYGVVRTFADMVFS